MIGSDSCESCYSAGTCHAEYAAAWDSVRAVYGDLLAWVCLTILSKDQFYTDIEVATLEADKVDAETLRAGCCAMTNTRRVGR